MKSLLSAFAALLVHSLTAAEQPNILWLTSEDHGPHMGCYGDKYATTPNVDALASRGMLFKKCWSNGPVCAAARTTIIAGMYPPSTGGEHMRSMTQMPKGTKMYPQFLREAGYYCTNNSKEDYNLEKPEGVWDESSGKAHWKNRRQGQPFFAIFNEQCSHESQLRKRPHQQVHDPKGVRVPAYHPDTPEVRQDWAQYYDKVTEADASAGERLKEIAAAGLAEDTIIFYYADHGSGMPRNKRWPCNSGLHVPMVVYFPPKWQHLAPKEYGAGVQSDRLVSFVDLAPTLLSIIGVKPPEWMQGHAFAGPHQTEPQPFLHGERGRMDERMDLVRSVTDGRYVYLRNYYPHVSQAQRVAYQFETPTTRIWNQLFTEGRTNAAQSLFWREPKDSEELYDLQTDPDEVVNLASSPDHRAVLDKLRAAQREHLAKVRDVCFLPEHEMHRRAEGGTPYDMAHDAAKYPFEKILAAADLASDMDSTVSPELARLMTEDKDSAVRFWGALGLLMRGESAEHDHAEALLSALDDASLDVRIPAAQSLGLYGDAEARGQALATLGSLATPAEHDVLTAMAALAAVEALGSKADGLKPQIAAMKPDGPSPDGRYNSYVPRLIANIVPVEKPTAGKGKKKKGKK